MDSALYISLIALLAIGLMAMGYGLVCYVAYLSQRKLTYYPMHKDREVLEKSAELCNLSAWEHPESGYIGWKVPLASERDSKKPLRKVVVFHGNAGFALHRLHYVECFRGLENSGDDWDVSLFEYPGYGFREGTPTEESFTETAAEAVELLIKEKQAGEELYILGESIGSGVACQMAARYADEIKGVILTTPFDSLINTAARMYSYLPVRSFYIDQFDSVEALSNYPGRVAAIIAEKDEIIKPDQVDNLFSRHAGGHHREVIKGQRHNSILYTSSQAWWKSCVDFVTG